MIILLSFAIAKAQVPRLITVQGRLLDDSNNPIITTVSVNFRIEDFDGNGLWTNTISITPDSNGVFDVILGRIVPLDVPFNEPTYLQIAVEGEPLSPRYELTTLPYGFRGITAENLSSSSRIYIQPYDTSPASYFYGLGSLQSLYLTGDLGIGVIPAAPLHIDMGTGWDTGIKIVDSGFRLQRVSTSRAVITYPSGGTLEFDVDGVGIKASIDSVGRLGTYGYNPICSGVVGSIDTSFWGCGVNTWDVVAHASMATENLWSNNICLGGNCITGWAQSCPAGSSIRIINNDGTVVCETDDLGSQDIWYNILADGSTLVPDLPTDTLTFSAGSGISITGNAFLDVVTIRVQDCEANEILKRNAGDTDWICAIDIDTDTNTWRPVCAADRVRVAGTCRAIPDCDADTQTLNYDTSTETFSCGDDDVGSGDITGVIAGSGLTGGGLSGDVTLDVSTGYGIKIQSDTVTRDCIHKHTTSTTPSAFSVPCSMGTYCQFTIFDESDKHISHGMYTSRLRQGVRDIWTSVFMSSESGGVGRKYGENGDSDYELIAESWDCELYDDSSAEESNTQFSFKVQDGTSSQCWVLVCELWS